MVMKRYNIIVDILGVLKVGKILNNDMLIRLKYAATQGYKITVMFSTTVVDIHKREELHACTGWLTDNWVPWDGIFMRDKNDEARGLSYNELKLAWINTMERETIARLYDFDKQSEDMWKKNGLIKATDWVMDGNSHITRIPCWVPQEVVDEPESSRRLEKRLLIC
jgi:hypothetical protein